MVERITKKYKVRLVNNEEAEILLYETIGFVTAQNLKSKLLKGVSVSERKAKSGDIELPADRSQELMIDTLNAVWADKNYKVDDVRHEDLILIAEELVAAFLTGTGYRAEVSDNESSELQKDQ